MIELDYGLDRGAKIRVVGVGGGGGNAITSMIRKGLHGVDFFAVNTDLQALERNEAPNKIQIGKNLTRGLGAGADPSVGHRAVEEDRDEIARAMSGSDMVFVTAGMGGGTGTGGGPLVANIAKSVGALVVGIVTRPFNCEGKKRMAQAEMGLEELKKQVDTLIIIPNQKLLSIVERNTPLQEAFDIANQVLYGATRGISELITVPGLINVDFADVRTVMKEMGDWLHRDAETRLADLSNWLGPMLPIRDGAALVLKLLRESGKPARLTALQGTFQQMLGGRTAQMVRIRVPRAADCVPEISANRYALNIRYVTAGAEPRPRTVERDIDFELTFCNL